MTLKTCANNLFEKNDVINTIESTLDLEKRLWGTEEMHKKSSNPETQLPKIFAMHWTKCILLNC